MSDPTPATVTMHALQRHTYHGQTYDVGTTFEADAGDVESIEVQGKAARGAGDGAHTYRTTEAKVPRTAVLTSTKKTK